MSHDLKAKQFADLHIKGFPVLLYNAWDAGSAKVIQDAGADAIATSSWAVAASQGYRDGEGIPLDFVESIVGRIVNTVELPVTLDFEGGYSEKAGDLAENISRILDLGVVGINFEDRVVHGSGLYAREAQAKRIEAIRNAAEKKGFDLFLNARTDVFFVGGKSPAELANDVIAREKLYAKAGASGLFVPGLIDDVQIERIAKESSLPLNVMVMDGISKNARLAELGVSRISYGSIPYAEMTAGLRVLAHTVFANEGGR